jgi:sugar lactone lactonase YvrE
MATATPATDERFRLGEGPVWDASRGRLLWVDIEGGVVLQGVLDGDVITVTDRIGFDGMVGAVAVAGDGTLLVAAQEHLVVRYPDGTREDGPRVVPAGEARRLNDGATDPAGRFLVGTLSLAGPSEREVLVRLEAGGDLTVVDDDLALSNGLAWSSDGRRMFSVDSLRRTVSVRDYDVESGAVGPRRVHLRVDGGLPDGIAMDADDHLWVAVWGGARCGGTRPTGPWPAGSRPVPRAHLERRLRRPGPAHPGRHHGDLGAHRGAAARPPRLGPDVHCPRRRPGPPGGPLAGSGRLNIADANVFMLASQGCQPASGTAGPP